MDPDNLQRGPRRARRQHALAITGRTAQEQTDPEELISRPLITDIGLDGSRTRGSAEADSDDVEGIQALARDLDEQARGERPAPTDDFLRRRLLSDTDNDDATELLGNSYDDAEVDEMIDDVLHDDDFEYGRGDMTDQIHVPGFDPVALGLKEINNLAHFSVSSHKPGNGVKELLSDDPEKYWQSDGQQPHLLTIHFLRRVEIRAIRFYVDYNQDESYTPTFVTLSAGTGHHDLIEFASMPLVNPVGWQEVDLSDVGGGDDDRSLCCWIVQMQVKENHQNGKDTHIRAIKLYALDENSAANNDDGALQDLTDLVDAAAERALSGPLDDATELRRLARLGASGARSGHGGLPDFMRDPEIR